LRVINTKKKKTPPCGVEALEREELEGFEEGWYLRLIDFGFTQLCTTSLKSQT